MSRDRLTERYARELREVDPDPRDWIEGPHHRPTWLVFDAWRAVALGVVGSVAIVIGVGVIAFVVWRLLKSG